MQNGDSAPCALDHRPFARRGLALWLALLMLLLAAPVWAQQTVRVGVYQNSPKVALASNGKPEGIFVDLIEAIAQEEGWQIEYIAGTWAEGLHRLEQGELDLMPDVARTPEREQRYAFHREMVLGSWNQVYARRGGGIRSMLDLQSKRVAVLDGSVQQTQMAQMADAFNLPVTLLPYPNYDAAFAAVGRDQADAVITNRFFGVRNARKYGLEDTAIIFSPSKLFFAAPKQGHDAMLAAIDRHLIAFKTTADSVYYRSLRRWMVNDVRAATPSWLVPVLAGALALLIVVVAWVGLLRRQVAAKTREILQRNEEILLINRTMRATGSRRELGTVLEEATRGALALTGFDGGVLCVRDAQCGSLRVGARVNAPIATNRASDEGQVCDAGCPAMLESVVKGRQHVLLAAGASGTVQACGNEHDATVRWNAYFPLTVQDRTIGVLCLFSRKAEPPPLHVMELVKDLCGPVALAMENAHLYQQAQENARELEQRVIARTAEAAELSAFLQAIINHSPNPIFYKGPDLRFRGCNNAYETIFGVDRADLIGKTVLELSYFPQADRENYQRENAEVLVSGGMLSREATMPFADGKVHQTLYSVSGFRGSDGSPAGLVGAIVDITPMKEAQAALREAMVAAEKADQIKSAFLATMSHELRTPMNSIIGFTGILLQGLAGPLNAEQGKQLGMVRDSARHLLALINDVLDLSKIEAGELRVACEPFDLARSIEKVAAITEPLAQKKGLSLVVNVAPDVGTMVSDARRVEQVLLNLLSNAIKFSDTGSIRLHAQLLPEFQLDAEHAPVPAVRLIVEDTGIGIKPEDMAVLFMPFRQIDSALSRKHEGTGLGLAICRRLVQLMGGTIEAQSQWGQGSVFTLTLPLQIGVAREPA